MWGHLWALHGLVWTMVRMFAKEETSAPPFPSCSQHWAGRGEGTAVSTGKAAGASPVLTPPAPLSLRSNNNPYASFGATLARDEEQNLWSTPHDVTHTEADDDRVLYNMIVVRNQLDKDSEVRQHRRSAPPQPGARGIPHPTSFGSARLITESQNALGWKEP